MSTPNNPMITVRAETPEDHVVVHCINEVAFEQPSEADLVDRLRQIARPYISLVAELEGRVVGHIFFSPVTVESEDSTFVAMGLAPMAVLPEYQRKAIGSLLVRQGLEECRRINHNIVFVLGHPSYYPRFGFLPASSKSLRSEYDVPDEVFMVIELAKGALEGRRGLVKYNPEFAGI